MPSSTAIIEFLASYAQDYPETMGFADAVEKLRRERDGLQPLLAAVEPRREALVAAQGTLVAQGALDQAAALGAVLEASLAAQQTILKAEEIFPEPRPFQCENCGAHYTEGELRPVRHIDVRVAPGEPMPAGECPSPGCGALCHLRDEADA